MPQLRQQHVRVGAMHVVDRPGVHLVQRRVCGRDLPSGCLHGIYRPCLHRLLGILRCWLVHGKRVFIFE